VTLHDVPNLKDFISVRGIQITEMLESKSTMYENAIKLNGGTLSSFIIIFIIYLFYRRVSR